MYFSIATPARVFSLTIPFAFLSPLSPRPGRTTRGTSARLPLAPLVYTKRTQGGLHQLVAYHADSSTLLHQSAKGVRQNTRTRWAIMLLMLIGMAHADCDLLTVGCNGAVSSKNVRAFLTGRLLPRFIVLAH